MDRWSCCCTAFPNRAIAGAQALPVLAAGGLSRRRARPARLLAGARPDPADLSNYAFDKLVNDALEIAAAAGYEGKRFHLVGHDWGGQVSWGVANAHPERLASLTVLSRPHPLVVPPRAAGSRTATRSTARAITRTFLEPETGRC